MIARHLMSNAQFLKRFQKTKADEPLTLKVAIKLEDEAKEVRLSLVSLVASMQRMKKEMKEK